MSKRKIERKTVVKIAVLVVLGILILGLYVPFVLGSDEEGSYTITGSYHIIIDDDDDSTIQVFGVSHHTADTINRLLTVQEDGKVGIGTVTPGYMLDVKAGSSVGSAAFQGGGDPSLTPGGTFTGASALTYRIQIDDDNGDPDTFEWSDDDGSNWVFTDVAITGSAQALNYGVTITFGDTDNHLFGDYWTFSTTVTNPFSLQNAAGTEILYTGNDGRMGIGTLNPGYTLDVKGKSNVGPAFFTGSGLDDMSTGGTFIGDSEITYIVGIDGTGGTDRFRWTDEDGGGPPWNYVTIQITGSAQELSYGVTITFGATTGHSSSEIWTFKATPTNPFSIQNAAGTGILYSGNNGNIGIGTMSPSYVLDVKGISTVGPPQFMGSGLNDMTNGGTFTGALAKDYHIDIDAIDQGILPNLYDTFRWTDNYGLTMTNNVAITGSDQTLSNGVTIKFAATTGHTNMDPWDFSTTVANPFSVQNVEGVRILSVTNENKVGIGTLTPQEKLTLGSGDNFAVEMAAPTSVSAEATTGGSLFSPSTYYFKVVALDGIGTTIGSNEDSAYVDGSSDTAISVSWTAPQGASSFQIYVGTYSDGQDRYHTDLDDASPFLFTAYGGGDGSTPSLVPIVTTAYVNKITASGDSWFLGGDVGIGTTSPDKLLHIGASGGTSGAIRFEASDGDEIDLGITTTDEFYIIGGNVGIGTIEPEEKLHIVGATATHDNKDYSTYLTTVIEEDNTGLQIIGKQETIGMAHIILTGTTSSGDNNHWIISHYGDDSYFGIGYRETTSNFAPYSANQDHFVIDPDGDGSTDRNSISYVGFVGIGVDPVPETNLDVEGGFATNLVYKDDDYTVHKGNWFTGHDFTILVNPDLDNDGDVTITLPDDNGAALEGQILVIKRVDPSGDHDVTIDLISDKIDGSYLDIELDQWDSIMIQRDGNGDWFILSSHTSASGP